MFAECFLHALSKSTHKQSPEFEGENKKAIKNLVNLVMVVSNLSNSFISWRGNKLTRIKVGKILPSTAKIHENDQVMKRYYVLDRIKQHSQMLFNTYGTSLRS